MAGKYSFWEATLLLKLRKGMAEGDRAKGCELGAEEVTEGISIIGKHHAA